MYENIHVCMRIYVYVCIICESLCMCVICLIKSPIVQYWCNKAGTTALSPLPRPRGKLSQHWCVSSETFLHCAISVLEFLSIKLKYPQEMLTKWQIMVCYKKTAKLVIRVQWDSIWAHGYLL